MKNPEDLSSPTAAMRKETKKKSLLEPHLIVQNTKRNQVENAHFQHVQFFAKNLKNKRKIKQTYKKIY